MSAPPDGPQALSELVTFSAGTVVSRVLLKAAGGSATVFAFAAGEGLSEHATPHDALVLVIDGEAEVTLRGQAYTIRAGEVMGLPASVPHAVHAIENVRMLLILLRDA